MAVSRPGDPLERQADAVAASVTASPTGGAPAAAAPSFALPLRLAAPAGGGEPAEAGAAASPIVSPAVESVVRSPGAGAPLPAAIRERIEPVLGVGLGDVEVHSGGEAQLAAVQLQARAFTVGRHIFLGQGESPDNLALMAHEATHVAQQQAVEVYRSTVWRSVDEYIPDFILDGVRSYARDVPGYTLLTVVAEYDPIADKAVQQTPENLVKGMLGLLPFGNEIAEKLGELDVLRKAFDFIDRGLTEHGLTTARLQREIDQAWEELSVTEGIDGNVAIISRHIDAVYQDVMAFARSIVDAVIQMVRDAAVSLAEKYLADTPVWELAKKVLHRDPLRGTPVAATTVEIIEDFLRLIGKEDALAQMRERGTLQRTADWLDTQIGQFMALVGELGALFQAGWDAIRPENIANLPSNLEALAHRAIDLVQRVARFAGELISAVLRIIKDALLGWLSTHAHKIPGFKLLTVILSQNPFTGESVPRTAENLIGGFFALLPGGEETFAKLAETGVIGQALAQIQSAMGRLGISLDLITNTFLGVWNTLSLEDLLAPVAAFERILEKFGEPLGRIVEFVAEVVKVVISLVLKLMNFPTDLLTSIINNAMQAIDDIQRDPIGFLVNMLEALKTGLSGFFDKILSYLLQGLADWLLRGLGQLGIALPTDLSFKSVLNLVLQVLGVTVDTLWQKLGKQIGEENLARIRGAVDTLTGAWGFIKDVQERGITAIWEYVKDKLGNLWDTLLGMAKDWIVTQIVEKVTAKLISMLDPTGVMAIVNSFIASFNAIQSAIEYRDILKIVNEYVTTFAAVAAGNIGPGAKKLEQGLAHAIPVAIGFLANQAGIANVPEKVVEIIKSLRDLIDEALDWLFEQAMRLGIAALGALGIGGAPAAPGEQPAPGAFAVHEVLKTADGEDHELDNEPNSFELAMASSKRRRLSDHPDAQVQAEYKAYKDAIAAATSREEKETAARQGVLKILAALKNTAGGQAYPRASAPGLGDISQHGAHGSSVRDGLQIWWIESEHVIPFATGRSLWQALNLYLPERGWPEDKQQTTIMIYYRAARIKTELDNPLSAQFEAEVAQLDIPSAIKGITGRHQASDPNAASQGLEVLDRVLAPLRTLQANAVARTVDAVAEENQETEPGFSHPNRERRAVPPQKEPPWPPEAKIAKAADRQYDNLIRLVTASWVSKEELQERLRQRGLIN